MGRPHLQKDRNKKYENPEESPVNLDHKQQMPLLGVTNDSYEPQGNKTSNWRCIGPWILRDSQINTVSSLRMMWGSQENPTGPKQTGVSDGRDWPGGKCPKLLPLPNQESVSPPCAQVIWINAISHKGKTSLKQVECYEATSDQWLMCICCVFVFFFLITS